MVELSPFGLTWDGDWSLLSRMLAAHRDEVGLPEDFTLSPELRTRLIRQSRLHQDPLLLMKVMDGGRCRGFLGCRTDEAASTAEICILRIDPAYRRQGWGSQAILVLERLLRRRDIRRLHLIPAGESLGFWQHCGFRPAGERHEKELPLYQGGAPMQLLCYTRQAQAESIYAPKLADSVHFALIEGGVCTPLLHNSGIVYAKAVPGEMNVLHPYSLRHPRLTREGDTWHILAQRIECDGSEDAASEGHLLHFTSPDLIHFTEEILLPIDAPLAQDYLTHRDELPDLAHLELPEGCIPGSVTPIDEETARRLRVRFLTPVNVANEVPAEVEAASPEALAAVRAVARYSDGSSVQKRIDWDTRAIDWSTPGRYAIRGRIHQDRYEFPMAWHKADPAVCRWQGKYYFISTNDLDGNHTLFIREADSLPGLVTAQQTCILDTTMYPHLGALLWAPELHIIRDRLYILHAGTPGPFGQEQSHVMALKPGGNPTCASDWEMPRRVVKRDGSPLYEKGITLDMTVFWSAGRLYAAWSQRQFDPVDLGAWLYIAEMDPEAPWRLLTEPQMLTTPEYGWENNHTFVAEGPFALYRGGRILLTYSGALVDSTYVVGLLSMADGADPLNPASWTKENYPLLTSRSVQGEYGPGHNAYVTDEEGLVWNTYHARPGFQATGQGSSSDVLPGSQVVFGARSSGIRRVHFNAEDFPLLDMTEEMDLDPRLAAVETVVVVK